MKSSSIASEKSGGAVPVSVNLQLTVVWSLALATIASIVYAFLAFRPLSGGISISSTLQLAGYSFLPIVIFIIAYFTSARYPYPINRWFIAVIKAMVVTVIFNLLQSIYNFASIYYVRSLDSLSSTTPPAWWLGSLTANYILMVICVLVFLLVSFRPFRSRRSK